MYRQYIAKKTSLSSPTTPINKQTIPTNSSGSLSGTIQRAAASPESLREDEWLQLDRAIGTRATNEIKSGKSTSYVPEFKGISAQFSGNSGQIDAPIQKKDGVGVSEIKSENKTGLPDNLKAGAENLSGYSLDEVKVHYNSSKPAHLQAHAYTQGTNIHVAPGQEKHLPHETWHVVQQMQGRVKPTTETKGLRINDDGGLEKEADVMGGKAVAQNGQGSKYKTRERPLISSISIEGTKQMNKVAQKQPATEAISLENFMKGMTERYQQDFIDKVQKHSDGSIDKTKAEEYFRTFVKALYNNRIAGLGKGYGNYDEGGAPGEKGRQNLVDAFHQETSEFIRAFGSVAAQGSTLLWSSYGIGRFAVDDKDILKSAGVTDKNAQPLSQTSIGKLWDELKIAGQSDEQIGYIWDSQYQVWASVSKEIVANAEGEVHVFLPKNIGASTIFWNVELPELRMRMAKFTDNPKVTKITIHRLTDDALKRVNEAENDAAKKQVMLESSSWENLDFSQASLEVPNLSDKQKKLLKDSNPSLLALIEKYVSNNQTPSTITIHNLTQIGQNWKNKANSEGRPSRKRKTTGSEGKKDYGGKKHKPKK